MTLQFNRTNVTALALLFATLASWLVFESFSGQQAAAAAIIMISACKVKAIMSVFMEVSETSGPWGMLMSGWLAVVSIAMLIAEIF